MRISQIKSAVVCGEAYVGKWYCSEHATASDGHTVHRYLQHDGTWGQNTQYFDTENQIKEALKKGHKPDFHCDKQELYDRATMREDYERSMEEFDSFEPAFPHEEADY